MINGNLSQFQPHPLARSPHFQAAISSLRQVPADALLARAQPMTLETQAGVRLQGVYSAQPGGQAQELVFLLHGWLGCTESNYVLALGDYLYRRGYAVFRLNLRDHGESYTLNSGIFRSDRLAEVEDAVRQVAHLAGDRPMHLIGASLGGNFVLRLAWRHSRQPIPNLGHTLAICPALNPHQATLCLDRSPLYLTYFRRRWRRAFLTKQQAFPDLYDFSAEVAAPTCMAMTETFVQRYSPYPDALAYFEAYAVTPAMLADLTSPVTMLTAADDPVVPVADFEPFVGLSPRLQVQIQPYGGHVGFIDIFPFQYWLNQVVGQLLQN